MSSINRKRVPYHRKLKSNFDRLLYIIFFIKQIHRVFSVNGEASRIKRSKKKMLQKKLQNKNIHNQNLKATLISATLFLPC